MIIGAINPRLRGWFEYFKQSHRHTFSTLDGWIRMRLRSILRKRLGKEGRGRGSDHQRWPNVFFAEQGLYSLNTAHVMACQSSSLSDFYRSHRWIKESEPSRAESVSWGCVTAPGPFTARRSAPWISLFPRSPSW